MGTGRAVGGTALAVTLPIQEGLERSELSGEESSWGRASVAMEAGSAAGDHVQLRVLREPAAQCTDTGVVC